MHGMIARCILPYTYTPPPPPQPPPRLSCFLPTFLSSRRDVFGDGKRHRQADDAAEEQDEQFAGQVLRGELRKMRLPVVTQLPAQHRRALRHRFFLLVDDHLLKLRHVAINEGAQHGLQQPGPSTCHVTRTLGNRSRVTRPRVTRLHSLNVRDAQLCKRCNTRSLIHSVVIDIGLVRGAFEPVDERRRAAAA